MTVNHFICPRTESIFRGIDSLQTLGTVLDQYGIQRVFLMSTPSLVRNGLFDQVKAALGERCVGVFTDGVAHTPERIVKEAVDKVKEADVQALISFGGSSVVDLAKSTILTLAEGDNYPAMKISFSPETGPVIPPLVASKLAHIAIPTTLSSSEFTFASVITDEVAGEKNLYADPKLTPKVVIQDPKLTVPTPDLLWASSGAKLFCDCIESLCSPRANPFNNAIAHEALKLLHNNLGESRDPANLKAREACFEASYMGLAFSLNSGIGMVAALRHQLGGNQGVGHGIASAIVLPHVLRWNRPKIIKPLADIAVTLGLKGEGEESLADAAIESISSWIQSLAIPSQLRDVDVDADSFTAIAEHAASDLAMAYNPRPSTAEEIKSVLEAAW